MLLFVQSIYFLKIMAASFSRLLFIILFLTTVEQIAVDVYLPSLPAMTEYFQPPTSYLQHTLTLYLLGFALSPLIFGPISDRYGRRPVLLFNLILYLIASLVCAFAGQINWLLGGGLINGIAGGGIVVANAAMSRDCYRGKALISVSSYMSMVWSLIPIIAPTIGGYVQYYFGWRANFFLVFIYTLPITLYLMFYLPETNPCSYGKLEFKRIILRYTHFLKDKYFMVHVAATAITFAITIAFNTAAPFLFQDQLHLNAVQFGWLSFGVAFSYLIGTLLNNYLIRYLSVVTLLWIGQAIMLSMSLVMLIIGLFGLMTVGAIALPASLVILGEGFVYPNSAALAFDNVKKHTGIATALFGSLQLIACALTSAIVAMMPEHSQIPIASILVILSVSLVLCLNNLKEPMNQAQATYS